MQLVLVKSFKAMCVDLICILQNKQAITQNAMLYFIIRRILKMSTRLGRFSYENLWKETEKAAI